MGQFQAFHVTGEYDGMVAYNIASAYGMDSDFPLSGAGSAFSAVNDGLYATGSLQSATASAAVPEGASFFLL